LASGKIAVDNPKTSLQFPGAFDRACRYDPQAAESRVAAIADKAHNRFHPESADLGLFEFGNDHVVAAALPQRTSGWVFDRGASFLRGPVIPSSNADACGFVAGFDSDPMVRMPHSPANVNKLTIRPIHFRNFNADVERVWEVYNSAGGRNWGFISMREEEFQLRVRKMNRILKPELVLIAEVRGCVVGFALAVPDIRQAVHSAQGKLVPTGLIKILYYQRLVKNVRLFALGVVEEYRACDLAAGRYRAWLRNATKLGYGDCEMSWILDDDVLMNRSPEATGARRYKTYGIYEWN